MSDSEPTDPTLNEHTVTIDGVKTIKVHLRIGEKIQVTVVSKETLVIEEKYKKLLRFVKSQYCKTKDHTEGCFNNNYLNCQFAEKLLKEIGEL